MLATGPTRIRRLHSKRSFLTAGGFPRLGWSARLAVFSALYPIETDAALNKDGPDRTFPLFPILFPDDFFPLQIINTF